MKNAAYRKAKVSRCRFIVGTGKRYKRPCQRLRRAKTSQVCWQHARVLDRMLADHLARLTFDEGRTHATNPA